MTNIFYGMSGGREYNGACPLIISPMPVALPGEEKIPRDIAPGTVTADPVLAPIEIDSVRAVAIFSERAKFFAVPESIIYYALQVGEDNSPDNETYRFVYSPPDNDSSGAYALMLWFVFNRLRSIKIYSEALPGGPAVWEPGNIYAAVSPNRGLF